MRGCSFGCKFCQTPRMLRKVRYRSLNKINQIVRYYAKHFAQRQNIDIRFIAPNSLEYGSKDHRTPNTKALWELVQTVKSHPVRMFLGSFPSEIRPEFINPDTVEILQESATKIVAVGAQSASDRMLHKMKRGHSQEDIRNCVDFLLEGDLIPQLDFILGLPEEKNDEQHETLELIKKLIQRGCRIRLHHFMPLPGTPWSSFPPSKITSEIISEIGQLLRHKNINGSFFQQMDISKGIRDIY
jgi:B12-binding domain/radical SAM domain protein